MTVRMRKLDSLGYVSRGRSRHRPRDAAHLYGGPYPFVQTGDVTAAPLYLTEYTQNYSEAGLEQSRLWPPGTLCITIAANIAETAILGIEACFPDSVIGFIPDPNEADVRFIKYLFEVVLKGRYKGMAQGAAQDNLSQGKLLSIEFPVPYVDEQRSIADAINVYDDLVAINIRRIALLEEAARLIFKEWFVHLRFPGHEKVKVVDGVPEGWTPCGLDALAEINPQSIKNGSEPDTISYIDISCVSTGKIESLSQMPFADAPGRAKRIVAHGDIIWSQVRPNRRSYALIHSPEPDTIASTGFAVIRATCVPYSYLYLAITQDSFVGHLVSNAQGAAYPAVKPADFLSAKMIKPASKVVEAFNDVVKQILDQIHTLSQQNKKLTEARDLLLPRLMDGRITP